MLCDYLSMLGLYIIKHVLNKYVNPASFILQTWPFTFNGKVTAAVPNTELRPKDQSGLKDEIRGATWWRHRIIVTYAAVVTITDLNVWCEVITSLD